MFLVSPIKLSTINLKFSDSVIWMGHSRPDRESRASRMIDFYIRLGTNTNPLVFSLDFSSITYVSPFNFLSFKFFIVNRADLYLNIFDLIKFFR